MKISWKELGTREFWLKPVILITTMITLINLFMMSFRATSNNPLSIAQLSICILLLILVYAHGLLIGRERIRFVVKWLTLGMLIILINMIIIVLISLKPWEINLDTKIFLEELKYPLYCFSVFFVGGICVSIFLSFLRAANEKFKQISGW